MAIISESRTSNFSWSEQWLLLAATTLVFGFLGYVIYDAVMATASELLQRLLVISPLLLVVVVHWMSTGTHFSLTVSGTEPAGALHHAGGSPWGVAIVLVLLLFLILYQPSFSDLFY